MSMEYILLALDKEFKESKILQNEKLFNPNDTMYNYRIQEALTETKDKREHFFNSLTYEDMNDINNTYTKFKKEYILNNIKLEEENKIKDKILIDEYIKDEEQHKTDFLVNLLNTNTFKNLNENEIIKQYEAKYLTNLIETKKEEIEMKRSKEIIKECFFNLYNAIQTIKQIEIINVTKNKNVKVKRPIN